MNWNPSKDPVVFGPEIWTLQNQGGISRYFFELVTRLDSLGVRVICLTPTSSNIYLKKLPDRLKIRIVYRRNRFLNYIDYLRIIRNIPKGAIFHPTYFAGIPSIYFNRFLKIRTVVTVFDMISEIFPSEIPRRFGTIDYKKHLVERSNCILAISKNTKNDLINILGAEPNKIGVTLLGVGEEFRRTDLLASSPRKKFFLYVGKRGGYKNFKSLLLAFSLFHKMNPDFRILAIGGEEVTQAEQSSIVDLGLQTCIEFMQADDNTLRSLYQEAAGLVYPSLYEGFGLPPLEAMSMGCPVVAASSSSIPEVCGHIPYYFDPNEETSLLRALLLVQHDSDAIESKINAGIEWSRKFTWELAAMSTLENYKSI
jgi:glycosyltransferase involved in cell wall biosynthesis